VTNPFTEQVVGTVPEGTVEDVDRRPGPPRGRSRLVGTSLDDRVKACRAIAEGLKARAQEVALYASTEMGAPWQIAVMVQAGLPVIDFASMEDVADQVEWERARATRCWCASRSASSAPSRPGTTRCTRSRPRSRRRCWPAAPIVVKPSELVPGVAYVLAEVIHDAGLPPGVFNLVTGTGPVVGEAIVKHEAVDMVSFTGSTRAGRRGWPSWPPRRPSARRSSSAARARRCCSTTCPATELQNAVAGSLTGLPHQLRPDVQRAHPPARAAARSTRCAGCSRSSRSSHRRRPARAHDAAGPARSKVQQETCAVHPHRARRGRPARRRRP
jgi:hypothetical protein